MVYSPIVDFPIVDYPITRFPDYPILLYCTLT